MEVDIVGYQAEPPPTNVRRFRRWHVHFIPGHWWVERSRKEIRHGWLPDWVRSEAEGLIRVLLRDRLRTAWLEGFPEDQVLELVSSDVFPKRGGWTYQRALMFLHAELWRAKICGQCARHFIAEHSQRSFCSMSCSAVYRKLYKAKEWKKRKRREIARRRQ